MQVFCAKILRFCGQRGIVADCTPYKIDIYSKKTMTKKAVEVEPREIKVLESDRLRAARKIIEMGGDRNSASFKAMYGDLNI